LDKNPQVNWKIFEVAKREETKKSECDLAEVFLDRFDSVFRVMKNGRGKRRGSLSFPEKERKRENFEKKNMKKLKNILREYLKASPMCSGDDAPPDATTGTVTLFATAFNNSMSYPLFVPSRSMLVKRISPAPLYSRKQEAKIKKNLRIRERR